jgi:GntR family transcriptional regulator/MocR family aminotransferase
VDVHITFDGRTGRMRAIYQQLRAAVLDGRLRTGDALPPSRQLAEQLGVARATIVGAYDQLTSEGFITSHRGSGTFVTDVAVRAAPATGKAPHEHSAALLPRPIWNNVRLEQPLRPPATFDFRTGLADTSAFPFQAWRRLSADAMSAPTVGKAFYGNPAGYWPLRQAIARHIAVSRGVVTDADEVTITNGTQQAVDLIARVLLGPGDRAAVEDPGYEPPRRLLETLGVDVVGVPVDDEGLVVDAIPQGTKLVYLTPAHQYPLGMVMTLRRRAALLEWARRNKAAIVEDDYDSEFRFAGRPVQPIQTLDGDGRVVYVGSFSKTILPTLRVGYIVTPTSLTQALHAAKYLSDWHTSLPIQQALAGFIDEGLFARHIRSMRRVYEQRHRLIVSTIRDRFADRLHVVPSTVGIHMAATAPGATPDEIEEVVRRAHQRGVGIQPLARYAVDRAPQAGLLLGYGAIATEEIPEGLDRLLASFKGELGGRRRRGSR